MQIATWRLVLCVASFATATSKLAAQVPDWNTGPGGSASRDCRSTYRGPDDPDILWQEGLPAIVAQQAVIEGNVVIMARIASFAIPTGTTIVAHDLHTGEILWTKKLPFNQPDEWRSRVSAVRDGQVYATRAGNTAYAPLYALDIVDGSILWESEELINESSTEGLSFASDGDPVVGSFDSVVRIEKDDGSTVWATPRGCPTTDGCMVSVYGDRGYLWEPSPAGPQVSTIDLTSGNVLYSSAPIGGGFIQQLGLSVGPDGTVYAPRTQNNPVTDFFVALEDTGTELLEDWSVPMGYAPFGTMGVGPDGHPYTYSTNSATSRFTVLKLDAGSGETLASSVPLGYGVVFTPRMAIDADGKVFLTNGSGQLYCFDPDLTLRWTENITNINLGGPALGQYGTLIVCGAGTDVRAYRTACATDLSGDGVTDAADLAELLGDWGLCTDCDACAADLNGDCLVDAADLALLLGGWGPCA